MLFNEPNPICIVFLLSNKINILVVTIVKKENKTSKLMVVKVGLCAPRDNFIMQQHHVSYLYDDFILNGMEWPFHSGQNGMQPFHSCCNESPHSGHIGMTIPFHSEWNSHSGNIMAVTL